MIKLETPEDWWTLLNNHWKNIRDIFWRCNAPMDGHEWRETSSGEVLHHELTMGELLERAKGDKDHETMLKYLNLTWIAAPDKPYIHQWPSWHVLCDLCSEGAWIFDPEAQVEGEEPT